MQYRFTVNFGTLSIFYQNQIFSRAFNISGYFFSLHILIFPPCLKTFNLPPHDIIPLIWQNINSCSVQCHTQTLCVQDIFRFFNKTFLRFFNKTFCAFFHDYGQNVQRPRFVKRIWLVQVSVLRQPESRTHNHLHRFTSFKFRTVEWFSSRGF